MGNCQQVKKYIPGKSKGYKKSLAVWKVIREILKRMATLIRIPKPEGREIMGSSFYFGELWGHNNKH
jgi:hypothetical protein